MSDLIARASLPGLDLELRTDTQYATAYLDGAPFLTLQRGRRYVDEPTWRAFTTQGQAAFSAYSSAGAVRRVEALVRVQRARADRGRLVR